MRQQVVCIKNSDVFHDTVAMYKKQGWYAATPVTRSVKAGSFRSYCVTLRISEFRWTLIRAKTEFKKIIWLTNAKLKGCDPDVEPPMIFAVDPLITKV